MPKRSSSEDSDGVGAAFAALQHVIDKTESPSDDVSYLKARISELERVCDEVYQFVKVAGLPARVIAFLDAARRGQPIHGSILPITNDDLQSATTAATMGRKGGLKGGKARAANLSQRQLRAIAKKAANARWKDRKE